MPVYIVTYIVKHTKEFNVPSEETIRSVFNQPNDIEIISIVEKDGDIND
jgi:hypothetical protein